MFEGTFSDVFNISDPPRCLINFACVALSISVDNMEINRFVVFERYEKVSLKYITRQNGNVDREGQ